MILHAIKFAKKRGRTIYISKSAKGKGVDVCTLDPLTPEEIRNLDAFFTPIHRVYALSVLGIPEEPNAINWQLINLPLWQRILVLLQARNLKWGYSKYFVYERVSPALRAERMENIHSIIAPSNLF